MKFLIDITIIIKLLFIFIIIFVLLPRRIFKPAEDDSPLDTFFINLIHMVFITILLVPFFVILNIYDLLTILVSYILLFFSPNIYDICKQKSLIKMKEKLWSYEINMTVYFLDILEARIKPLAQFKEYLIHRFVHLRERLSKLNRVTIVYIFFFIGIFGYAAYLRLYDSFHHITIGTSDPFVVIKYVKDLERNKLFSEAIYPEGYFSILSVFHLISFLDLVHIIRFLGPLIALVLVLSVYYVTLKVTLNRWAALISAFIYGTFTTPQLPISMDRQTTTLAQEFNMVYLLPCLFFLLQYVSTKKRRYLFFFFEAFVILCKIHTIVAVMASFGIIAIFISGLITRLWDKRSFINVILVCVAAVILGHLTIVIGYLSGWKLHEPSLGLFLITTSQITSYRLESSLLVRGIFLITLFIFIYIFFFCRTREEKIKYCFFCLFYFILIVEYEANFFHLRFIVHPIRTQQFVALIGTVMAGFCFHLITLKGLTNKPLFPHRGFYPVITLLTLLILGTAFPAKPPTTYKMGYDAAMANYLRISEEYMPFQWLIVSQVEEYPLCLYKGWHMMTFDFLERYNPTDEKLPIDTPDIFFFVEKKIFKIPIARTQKDYDWRYDQMRRMEEWCQIYMLHHDDMHIFYEDEDFVVYTIHKEEELEPILPHKNREKKVESRRINLPHEK